MNTDINIVGKIALVSIITTLAACGGESSSSVQAPAITSHVFAATNGSDGTELYISDGTKDGTKMLKDIHAGYYDSNPEQFVNVSGNTFFVAQDYDHGIELWKTDGTEAGTEMVKDIETGGSSSSLKMLTEFNNKLFFRAYRGTSDEQLWTSDGTEGGTELFKGFALLKDLTVVGDTLFFSANGRDGNGVELWKSDGTVDGTVMVKDIYSSSSHPQSLTAVGDTLYFTAYASGGRVLWKSDGTEAGTVPLTNSVSGPGEMGRFTAVEDKLFFTAFTTAENRELWVSDGTEAGTKMVRNIADEGMVARAVAQASGRSSLIENMTAVGRELFFTADDGIHGLELWKSDGSEAGTVLVKDINSQDDDGSNPSSLIAFGDTLLFSAATDDSGNTHSIWSTDGTEAGTVSMLDTTGTGINNDFTSIGIEQYSNESLLFIDGTNVLMTANFGEGIQLLSTDGTAGGTKLITTINPSGDAFYFQDFQPQDRFKIARFDKKWALAHFFYGRLLKELNKIE